MLRAIIVDDEPLARDLLEAILSEIDDIEIVLICANGREAIDGVIKYSPDVLFLDIEMPELTGFDVINALQTDILPKIIFTTAFSEYALDAFKVNALNYILKPVHETMVKESLDRVRQSMVAVAKPTMLTALDRAPSTQSLALIEPNKITMADAGDIIWLEAAGDYVCVHLPRNTKIIRRTLKAFMNDLPPQIFQRIHRSTIVNINHISEMTAGKKGEALLTMSDNHCLKVSRTYGQALRSRLKSE
jgi:two-component system LytT family response regulator